MARRYCEPVPFPLVEQLEHVFRWASEHCSITFHDDRPFDQDRVFDHRLDPFRIGEFLACVLGLVRVLSLTNELLRFDAKQPYDPSQLTLARRILEIFDYTWLDAAFLQKGEGSTALAAAWVVIDGDRRHR